MKLVHAADLHIDSPLLGLERYEGAPVARARGATRAAFRRVIDVALEERASFLVLAGDVFDGDWRDANTGLFFVSELARLREIDCHVLLLRGNHDHELTRTLLVRMPDWVHVFGTPSQPEGHSHVFESRGVAFHGVSYPQKRVTESLLGHYPRPLPGLLNVGVLHTNCVGSAAHDRYAPCTVNELAAFGYGYWALGHVHAHQILARDPWVVYPGNTQGRHAREPGPKGCCVLTTSGTTVTDVKFVETSSMRFVNADVVLGESDEEHELEEKVRRELDRIAITESGKLAAVRLTVSGTARAHAMLVRESERVVQNLRSMVIGRGDDIWLEKVILDTRPLVPLEDMRASPGLVGELLRNVAHLRTEDGEPDLQALASEVLGPLRTKLRAEGDEIKLPLTDTPVLVDLLTRVEALLAEQLTEPEES